MIPAGVQTAVDDLVSDGSDIALTILLAVVAVFAAKFLIRGVATASASAGLNRIFRR